MPGVRFAPSPTGAFHIGNFRTAWISHWWARRLARPWVVRFENIDAPRNVPGAMESQLREMRLLGLEPDRVEIQSERADRHWELLCRAAEEGRVYPCVCSRKDVRDALAGLASAPHGASPVYSGRCRNIASPDPGELAKAETLGWRFRMPDESGAGDFLVARTIDTCVSEFGRCREANSAEQRYAGVNSPASSASGGPVREGFVPAYNWACALDDFVGDYDLLVRAWDLAPVAAQQRAIMGMLGHWGEARGNPAIFHCSLVVGDDGKRLEKRNQGITMPELAARGIPPARLAGLFESSFERDRFGRPDAVPTPGMLFGEAREEIRLAELLRG